MKRLLIVLLSALVPLLSMAESLTLTVTAYNEVSLSGDVSDDISAIYIQKQTTKYRSRLLAGDTALLTINCLPVGTLDSVMIMVHSNATSGAGSLRMAVDGADVWSIADAPFSNNAWYGAYSADYVPLKHSFTCPTGNISLQIVASANSIYFQSLTLYYSVTPASAHMVRFSTQSSARPSPLKESAPGAGVTLPSIVDPNDKWTFLGWTESCEANMSSLPLYWLAGMIYHPQTDITLHALYSHRDASLSIQQDTLRLTGEYAIVQAAGFSLMAEGGVVDKQIKMQPCSLAEKDGATFLQASYIPLSARYWLDFLPGDSVTITCLLDSMHVGYKYAGSASSRYLFATDVAWQWMEGKNHSIAFYHNPSGDHAQIMMPSNGMEDDSYWLCDQYLGLFSSEEYLLLFDVSSLPTEPAERLYSNYPHISAVETVSSQSVDWSQPVSVYSVDGRCVFTGLCSRSELPTGLWIVRQGNAVDKIMK